jgi:hypothetical protein
MTGRIMVTTVHHVSIDIAASATAVWQGILQDYVEVLKFGDYSIERLEEPGALLGAYRMRLERDGSVVDDRIVEITERNDECRRLSLFGNYLSVPGGLHVFATYSAHEIESGARYVIDCHARTAVDMGADDTRETLAAGIASMKEQADASLLEYLERAKARTEAAT